MKSLFYPSFGQLVINDQPIPEYKEDEVLLKVASCGICGSELETFRVKSSRRKPPIIMGHEFSGVIIEKGAAVRRWDIGARVVSNSIIPCGNCSCCKAGQTNLCVQRQVFGMERNGAFAEFINVPEHCLLPIPEKVPLKEACLSEPLANGVHMVKLTQHVHIKKVLIIGAGPIGLMALQAFRSLRKASIIVTDLKEERLKVAKRLGAEYVIDGHKENLPGQVQDLIADESIDVVIDAVGMKITQSEALQVVRPGGAVILIGLHENSCALSSYDIILLEKQVLGTYAATLEDMKEALRLMADNKVDVASWVSYYSLDDGVKAFRDVLEAKDRHIKSVIEME